MTVSVCLIAKNEERAIEEWIAYQVIIGFDRVIIYDNDSLDLTPSIIKRIMKYEKSVDLISWPDAPGRRPQVSAYNHALQNAQTEWIAFFDTDEFLILHKHLKVGDLLKDLPMDASAVAINWLLFGSNGKTHADNNLVIERFTQCAIQNYGKNFFCKSIVRAACAREMLVHTAKLKSGYYYNAEAQRIDVGDAKTSIVSHRNAQLNHYSVKSREEFELKIARGHASRALEEDTKKHIIAGDNFWDAHDTNHVQNNDAVRFSNEITRKIQSWSLD